MREIYHNHPFAAQSRAPDLCVCGLPAGDPLHQEGIMFKVNKPFRVARGWVASVFLCDGAVVWTVPHADRNGAVRTAYALARA